MQEDIARVKMGVMERKKVLKEAVRIMRRYLPEDEYRIVLFGSWTKETAHAASDLDIGIVGPRKIDAATLLRIRDEVERIPTLRGIDVVDFADADERFRNAALRTAQSL